jgi:diguanylate cyclase (GGDEF)-like protein
LRYACRERFKALHLIVGNMSILIIDDSLVPRSFLRDLLIEFGYDDLMLCESVEEAYKMIGFNDPDRASVDLDLVLLDIDLSEDKSLEACREFSQHPIFCDVPIIIISGLDHLERLDASFWNGSIDYITKPPSRTELLARVRSALRLRTEMNQRKERETDLLILNERLSEITRELDRLSLTDNLTGLANRRAFNEYLHREWLRELRTKQPFSVVMIDIDHFKQYNDHYGHLEGDVCLQKVAWALQSALCRGGDLLARYGGEEFIAILPHTDERGASELAETLHARIRELSIPHDTSAVSSIVTISIGLVSVVPNSNLSPAQVVNTVEEALYIAKQSGRNRSMVATAFSSNNLVTQ